MADILKITTPLVEKQPVQANRPVADPSIPFELSDVTKVIRPADPTEILPQNTGFVPQEEAPKILANLLKDPSVTVGMIKNIFLLQEVIKLLPASNTTFTQEVQQLFDALLLAPPEVVEEMVRQEQSTTLFKGELFDQLRTLVQQNPGKPELLASVGVFLKGLNAAISKRDALDSVANNLSFFASGVKGSAALSEKLQEVITRLRAPEATEHFPEIKSEVLAVLKEVENSLLFTPQMEKVIPLVVYNLSRYNDNEDFLPDALRLLLSQMDGDAQKLLLNEKLHVFLEKYLSPEGARKVRAEEEESQVMQTLAKIIGRQAGNEELQLLSGDKLEKIVQSMLSSPSNFTPLLHFIVPVLYEDLRAFAEIWIDPDAEDAQQHKKGVPGSHMLMVFDVDGIGRFESELLARGKKLTLNLLCPPPYVDAFARVGQAIRSATASTGYSFESITVDKLEAPRSLMEVFTDLPHRRTGIDVKI